MTIATSIDWTPSGPEEHLVSRQVMRSRRWERIPRASFCREGVLRAACPAAEADDDQSLVGLAGCSSVLFRQIQFKLESQLPIRLLQSFDAAADGRVFSHSS